MAFDYKKEYREFYLPKNKPGLIEIPPMSFLAVRGQGDPNAEGGEYQRALNLLYPMAFTLKMSPQVGHTIDGFFDYVVPPLEGFWWQEGAFGVDYARKDAFQWISLIRLPDFVTRADFLWARGEATQKKKADFSRVEFLSYHEGLCVQCMHLGAYDDEPETVARMEAFAQEQGYVIDRAGGRFHHEIYLSDARRVPPERRKTVLRLPIIRL